jgi:hypothetical protein
MDWWRGEAIGPENWPLFANLDLHYGKLSLPTIAFYSTELIDLLIPILQCAVLAANLKQFFGLQLDRGNLSNALTDNLLTDLGLTTNDYNNGTTIQLVAFLIAEFPIQFLTKRYGFKYVLPTSELP